MKLSKEQEEKKQDLEKILEKLPSEIIKESFLKTARIEPELKIELLVQEKFYESATHLMKTHGLELRFPGVYLEAIKFYEEQSMPAKAESIAIQRGYKEPLELYFRQKGEDPTKTTMFHLAEKKELSKKIELYEQMRDYL